MTQTSHDTHSHPLGAASRRSRATADPTGKTGARRLRRMAVIALLALLPLIMVVLVRLQPLVQGSLWAANGYSAKWVCSNVFVAGRSEADAVADLPPNPLTSWVRIHVEPKSEGPLRGQARASVAGFFSRVAVYRPGYGCTLIPPGRTELALTTLPPLPSPSSPSSMASPASQTEPASNAESLPSSPLEAPELPWPWGEGRNAMPPGIDPEKLSAAIERAFEEPDPDNLRKTRAVVVIYDGQLVAERYAEGISADTALAGWSMTKTWINALIGRRVAQEELDIHQPAALPAWPAGDPRSELDVDVLLRMSSGLSFVESYSDLESDAVRMLFVLADSAGFAASRPLTFEPDTRWSYSSGTTNILSSVLLSNLGPEAYPHYPWRALFEPLGMHSAVFEPDASGIFVGSSFGWATARDWAKFGLLYLNDGVWPAPPASTPIPALAEASPEPDGRSPGDASSFGDQRLLPEGWVAYSTAPTPAAPEGQYGAHIWLNAGASDDGSDRPWPELPADLYRASGFQGQSVVVIPSRKCVVVRLGLTQDRTAFRLEEFLAGVLQALPESQAGPELESMAPVQVEAPAEAHLGP